MTFVLAPAKEETASRVPSGDHAGSLISALFGTRFLVPVRESTT
jgi:hypothetical protein